MKISLLFRIPHFIVEPADLRLWEALTEGLVVRDPLTGDGIPRSGRELGYQF